MYKKRVLHSSKNIKKYFQNFDYPYVLFAYSLDELYLSYIDNGHRPKEEASIRHFKEDDFKYKFTYEYDCMVFPLYRNIIHKINSFIIKFKIYKLKRKEYRIWKGV